MGSKEESTNKKSNTIGIIVFIILFVQFVIIMRLMSTDTDKPKIDIISDWEDIAKKSFDRGEYKDAIYYLEKVLANTPTNYPRYYRTKKKLVSLYELSPRTPQKKLSTAAPEVLKFDSSEDYELHELVKIADHRYKNGQYKEARKLYYKIMARIDDDKDSKKKATLQLADLRVMKCSLILKLRKKKVEDQIMQESLKLIQRITED
ncbi:hypothetical protein [Candidatus Uabimicrobium amorphum]|uniref:Tetratricopeptide repeat protein n=1 Tax=Uabimicrobium amorphum TaxID=2596890 RepID=A0A5S9F3Q7_UABAM|nr:hypothetical protein [Candidatus Uabimicrobium amorphum]BBM84995.1 hypothetical protein UABAM_03358 [Candidatus Uabimicrobium amorphum]